MVCRRPRPFVFKSPFIVCGSPSILISIPSPWRIRKKKKIICSSLAPSSGDSEHHWSSNDDVVRDLAIGGGRADEVEVNRTSQALRSGASTIGEGSEGASGGCATDGESASLGLGSSLALERKLLVSGGEDLLLGTVHGDGGEGGQDQVAARGARSNEGSSEGEDLLGRQRRVKGVGHRDSAGHGPDEALVASLDRVDGGSSGEHGRVRNDGRGTEVSGNTDLLEDGGSLHHGLRRGERVAEVVLAGLHGLNSLLSERALEDLDVRRLRGADGNEVVHLGLRQAEGEELVLGDGSEALLVEARLEPLQRQSTKRSCVSSLYACFILSLLLRVLRIPLTIARYRSR